MFFMEAVDTFRCFHLTLKLTCVFLYFQMELLCYVQRFKAAYRTFTFTFVAVYLLTSE